MWLGVNTKKEEGWNIKMGHNDLCVTSEHHFCGMENKVNKLKII
jgi:hypothetical protein